jgi:starch synthase (maltosyl-transferring)
VEKAEYPVGRFPITKTSPVVDGGKYPVKAFEGEVIDFSATAFREGHDKLAVELVLTDPAGKKTRHQMHPGQPGLDEWVARIQLSEIGTYQYQVSAWDDEYSSWEHATRVKLEAGVDEELMMLEGRALLERMSTSKAKTIAAKFQSAIGALGDKKLKPIERFEKALASGLSELAGKYPLRERETLSDPIAILCERKLAGSGSWYEFFPRSEGAKQNRDGSWVSGTFKTATKSLQRVSDMGFEVLYLPPIHPIGTSHRKGKNNTLVAEKGDPGSPWAIGSSDGGHDAIHPDLGTEKDFAAFVKAANKLGIEVAMDLALQASPDHPWVKSNPQWFTTRADGTIAYAENPPKKYQDIYPINFDNDPEGIHKEVMRVLERWISLGVKIYRVDNPHTKTVEFWQKLIAEVNAKHPEVIFLAEAFTRPAMMHTLGKIGFQQSYCYFSWRNTKAELTSYLNELSRESADFFRPSFWVNTPDILTEYLQFGGRPAFKIRATIAATAGPSWGMYAGFELYEAVARAGSEENIDNEKYEYKARDFVGSEDRGVSLAPRIRLLNKLRKENPALAQLRNISTHYSDDEQILVYAKRLEPQFNGGKDNTVIVVVNTDPHSVRETMVHLDMGALDLPHSFEVEDLITGKKFSWGEHNFVRLDSFSEPAHILRVIR